MKNTVYTLFFLIFLTACGSNSDVSKSPVCAKYPSAYEVLYGNSTFAKSEVSVCENSYYKATSEDGTLSTTADVLYIRLRADNGSYYSTEFRGQ